MNAICISINTILADSSTGISVKSFAAMGEKWIHKSVIGSHQASTEIVNKQCVWYEWTNIQSILHILCFAQHIGYDKLAPHSCVCMHINCRQMRNIIQTKHFRSISPENWKTITNSYTSSIPISFHTFRSIYINFKVAYTKYNTIHFLCETYDNDATFKRARLNVMYFVLVWIWMT